MVSAVRGGLEGRSGDQEMARFRITFPALRIPVEETLAETGNNLKLANLAFVGPCFIKSRSGFASIKRPFSSPDSVAFH
jgi:hypothetical protein